MEIITIMFVRLFDVECKKTHADTHTQTQTQNALHQMNLAKQTRIDIELLVHVHRISQHIVPWYK